MKPLSLSDIETLRGLILQNARELLAEAELLFEHRKWARAYALAHLSSEELAKLPILAATGVRLVNGVTINWKDLDSRLRSHSAKLKGLLFVDLFDKGVEPTARDIKVCQQKLSRVELFNELKNVSLYAGVYQGDLYKPNSAISVELATGALTAGRNRLELFTAVEEVTQGRISDLAKRQSYMKLLNTLGIE
jgi:AbiV family abortive infection protein